MPDEPKPSLKPTDLPAQAVRLGRKLGQHIEEATDTIGRALDGMILPRRFKKGKLGGHAGIEHEELTKLPSAPGKVYVRVIDYGPDNVQTQEITDMDAFLAASRPEWCVVRWINVDGLNDMKIIQGLAKKYRIHPLVIEDILHVPQRPKVDTYSAGDDYQARLFILCRMIQLLENRLHSEQISIIVGHRTVLTFQETHGDVWDPIRQRINTKGSRIRTESAGFLAYSLIDAMVDHAFPILEHYSDRLHDLEEAVLEHPDVRTAKRLHSLNRELMLLRRTVWPMRDVVQFLQREPHECLSDNTRTYLRDVLDHVNQVVDFIETYREMATNLADTYATGMGNKLNEVVKVLTVLTAIFTPPMFLASVWGMNFGDSMPETALAVRYYPWIYPVGFWGINLFSTVGMLWWFKRKGWW